MRKYIVLLLIFVFTGCGYTTRGFIYQTSKILIEPITNKIDITSEDRKYSGYTTYPILIENRLTNEIVNKFNIDGNLKVVNNDNEALKLICEITDYKKEALSYSKENRDEVSEQRLRLHVKIKLVDVSGEILKDKIIVGETTYFLTGSETAAQGDLIEDTARRVLESVVEEW